MKPPKKKKKDKTKKTAPSSDTTSQPSDPAVENRKRKFPGLSIPNDPSRAQTLLQAVKEEGFQEHPEGGVGEDQKVASEALNEVRGSY